MDDVAGLEEVHLLVEVEAVELRCPLSGSGVRLCWCCVACRREESEEGNEDCGEEVHCGGGFLGRAGFEANDGSEMVENEEGSL